MVGSDDSTLTRPSLAAALESAAPKTVRLVIVDGPDRGVELTLSAGMYLIGKAEGCALRLRDPMVSRRHLELVVGARGLFARDLDSKNGSTCDGTPFKEALPGIGSVLGVGRTRIKIASTVRHVAAASSGSGRFGLLFGGSATMARLFDLLATIAPTNATVLIHGETGTGKELCAQSIHAASKRSNGPLVTCDLAGMSGQLIESELFGHVRGAFTGADRDRKGLLAEADHGTLFIDEIGELALELQPRLLRVLEERKAKPVGSDRFRSYDVRILCATNRDLEAECAAGRFRSDLYHRLATISVSLPPLRERKEDIPVLVQRFLDGTGVELPRQTLALLETYDWPGNVRELRNVIERAVILVGDRKQLTPDVLGLRRAENDDSGDPFIEAKERLIAEWEREYLTALLRRTDGNVAEAARQSGLHRPYLHRLLKKHGLGGSRPPSP